jgi:nicotinate-nucleotide adenylyltransferase
MEKIDKKAQIAISDLIKDPPNRVSLLGGSFDPPHLGHVCMALSILSNGVTDEIWILPCANHPHAKSLLPLHERVHMCELAFRHLAPKAKVLPIEKFLPIPSFTAQTLKHLMSLYPNTHFDWLIGADLVEQLPTWQDASWLKRNVQFSVIGREGSTLSGNDNGFQINKFYGVEIPNIASHKLRQAIGQNETNLQGLDKAVLGYIRDKGLYQNKY